MVKYLAIVIIIFFSLSACRVTEKEYLGVPHTEIKIQLDYLLNNFYPRIIDTVNGGYWTNFENDWTLSENQDKMLVTQARGLWTAARAAEMFPENPVFRKAADHGYEFLTTRLWDTIGGGFYQFYYPDSAQKAEAVYKLTYGNAFALYALSQYALINKTPETLGWVKKAFDWLEKKVYDPAEKGYFSIWIGNTKFTGKEVPEGWDNPSGKDQNTGIHLLEALTTAYRVIPDDIVKDRLTETLGLVRDRMVNESGYLNLFFDSKWNPVCIKDSSRNYIIKNPWMDHVSFGHNIETAYLLVDASKALYGTPDPLTLKVARGLIDHTLEFGFDKDFYGIFDKGYEFTKGTVEVIDSSKVWWAQAEAWHALALFSELYPEDNRYAAEFPKMWNYITTEMVDKEHGGWYNSGLDANPRTVRERKVHAWKSCYHDGRALMQVFSYSKK